jgi:hypothetical protein
LKSDAGECGEKTIYCPSVPPGLVGRLQTELEVPGPHNHHDERENTFCFSKRKVAVSINREMLAEYSRNRKLLGKFDHRDRNEWLLYFKVSDPRLVS